MPRRNQFSSNEEYNAWYREYRAKNRKKFRAYYKKYNSEWRTKNGYHNEFKWSENNPEKRKAQQLARYAIKTGKILKRACLRCNTKQTIAHHPNYSKPLEIVWVCKIHHRQIHYRN